MELSESIGHLQHIVNEVGFPTLPPGLNNKRADFSAKKTWRPVMTLRRRYERPKLHHETSLPMAIAMLKIICICQVTLIMAWIPNYVAPRIEIAMYVNVT